MWSFFSRSLLVSGVLCYDGRRTGTLGACSSLFFFSNWHWAPGVNTTMYAGSAARTTLWLRQCYHLERGSVSEPRRELERARKAAAALCTKPSFPCIIRTLRTSRTWDARLRTERYRIVIFAPCAPADRQAGRQAITREGVQMHMQR